MGAHRCCDCDFTPATNCAALVAGDPPSPCNWWPDAYQVSVDLSGVSYVRSFHSGAAGQDVDCDDPFTPFDFGLAWCRTINWSWSLTTTIYRVKGAFGGIRCPDIAVPDDGFNVAGVGTTCPPTSSNANSDCGPTFADSSGIPFYSSPCCCDSAATLSGVADRTFVSTARQQLGTGLPCAMDQGTTTDSISFSRKVRVTGGCVEGRRRTGGAGGFSIAPDGTVRFRIGVAGISCGLGGTAWWPSASSLILEPFQLNTQGLGLFNCYNMSPPRCDEFSIFGFSPCPVVGSGLLNGQNSVSASSAPLTVEQPGVVGSMGVGDAFGMPLAYEHECGVVGGCEAEPFDLGQGQYLAVCNGSTAFNYACTQLTVAVTPL
jgi:hypothetical protein